MLLLVVSVTVLNFVTIESTAEPKAISLHNKNAHDIHSVVAAYAHQTPPANVTHIFDQEDNVLRVPTAVPHHKELKKKYLKKAPKRVIQRIIRTKKAKKRKIHRVTKPTTMTTGDDENDSEKETSTQPTTTLMIEEHNKNMNKKKKRQKKKWTPRQVRMPNPILKFKKDRGLQYRLKRNADVTDKEFYIIQDLDEVKFISREDLNNDAVVAHVKNYWK